MHTSLRDEMWRCVRADVREERYLGKLAWSARESSRHMAFIYDRECCRLVTVFGLLDSASGARRTTPSLLFVTVVFQQFKGRFV